MAFDIQCTYPQQVIKVSAVTLLPEEDPPTIEVVGDDFSAVDEVLLNGVASPRFIIRSKTDLTAELPSTVIGEKTINVTVVSYQLVFTSQSLVSFQFGKTNRRTSGINRLMQLFLKVLLTTPGSDIFNPTSGGGFLRNIGKTFSKENSGSVVGDIVVAVDNTAKQVAASQARQPRLPRDELLLSAKVLGARFDASQTALVVSILLTSQSGKSGVANLTV